MLWMIRYAASAVLTSVVMSLPTIVELTIVPSPLSALVVSTWLQGKDEIPLGKKTRIHSTTKD
jgi:hypothetical protein